MSPEIGVPTSLMISYLRDWERPGRELYKRFTLVGDSVDDVLLYYTSY